MAALLTAVQRRFILVETGINMVLGSVLPATAMYLTFGPFPLPFGGTEGFAVFLFKNAFGMGAVMTLLMTLAVRARIAKGRPPRLDGLRADHPMIRFIPRHALLRAIVFGLAAAAVPGTIAFAVALAADIDAIERVAFVLAMGGASLLVALFLTPLVIIGAMTDPVSRPALGPQT